jgi:hypothetical protein
LLRIGTSSKFPCDSHELKCVLQIWISDSSLTCRAPDGVGKILHVTGSVYGGTSIRSKLIRSLSAANFSVPIIVNATPTNTSDLSLVQGKGIGKMIGKSFEKLPCFFDVNVTLYLLNIHILFSNHEDRLLIPQRFCNIRNSPGNC